MRKSTNHFIKCFEDALHSTKMILYGKNELASQEFVNLFQISPPADFNIS